MKSYQMEMVEVVADTEGARKFKQIGEWVLRQSHVSLNTYLERATLYMKESETFHDGVKTGFGLLGVQEPIPKHITESHVEDFRDFMNEGEKLHDAVVRLGFTVIEDDPEMVECVRYILPQLGYANELVFTSGAGYGELLAELSARDQFGSQSAEILDDRFGPELDFGGLELRLDSEE